jgi:HSP20 family molecular chaperone IbpA
MANRTEIEVREKEAVPREGTRAGLSFRPDVDILESPDEFLVCADLPGVGEDGVSVELHEGELSIDARLTVEPEPAWRPLHQEYRLGGYHRRFRLSDRVDAQRISAEMRDGVLTLHLPKAARHRPRQIEVRAG